MVFPIPDTARYRCSIADVHQRIGQIDVRAYDKSRNYLDGAVTWLSPLTTHGVTDTAEIARLVLQHNKPRTCYRLLFELAWREYFHRVWQREENAIYRDLRHSQTPVDSHKLPTAIIEATTQIQVVDACIGALNTTGLMHNHARMWTAAITCNMAQTHWYEPARWMHFHLLDGDLASNTLSWQWIAGTYSDKKYVANQDNINKYSGQSQHGSWLDVPYEAFAEFPIPNELLSRSECTFTAIPDDIIELPCQQGDIALRSVWQLDPRWESDRDNHIVFIDTDLHDQWPMSNKRWELIRYWALQCSATIFKGNLHQLKSAMASANVVRRDYPACSDWPGEVQPRKWLYPDPANSYTSFSQFFKQVKSAVGL